MSETSYLQIGHIQLATHGRSIQKCHYRKSGRRWRDSLVQVQGTDPSPPFRRFMASCHPSIASRCQVKSAPALVCEDDRSEIASCPAAELVEQYCPACRSSTAPSAALPLSPGVLGRGFDRCRASLEGVQSPSRVSSSALYFPWRSLKSQASYKYCAPKWEMACIGFGDRR